MNLLHYQHVHKIGKVREKFFYDSRHLKYFTWDLTLHIQGYEVNLFSPTCNLVFFCVVVLRFEMPLVYLVLLHIKIVQYT